MARLILRCAILIVGLALLPSAPAQAKSIEDIVTECGSADSAQTEHLIELLGQLSTLLPPPQFERYSNEIGRLMGRRDLSCKRMYDIIGRLLRDEVAEQMEMAEERARLEEEAIKEEREAVLSEHRGRVVIKKRCSGDYGFALRWKDLGGTWRTQGFWRISAEGGNLIDVRTGDYVQSANSVFYLYAFEVNGGKGHRGSPSDPNDRTYNVDGKDYRFNRVELKRDELERWSFSIC